MKPNYYAVIPASVRYSTITPNAKLLYGEITALTSKEGYCWASNQYFADLYGVNTYTICRWVAELVKEGFITSIVENKNQRKIHLRVPQNCGGGTTKSARGVPQNQQHINTVNTTVKKAETKVSELPFLVVEETTKVVKPPRDKRAWELREKLYTMFEKDTGARPTPTMADYVRIVEALKSLEPKHIEEMVENALSYGGEKTVREVLTSRKIDIYRQENL